MSELIEVLERLCAAVERIADSMDASSREQAKVKGTPFPRHKLTVRAGKALWRLAQERGRERSNWTCEELVEVGSDGLLEVKGVGMTTLTEITTVLRHEGFVLR